MSIALMTEVWRLEVPTTDKMVLLALADWSNEEGACWPSMAQLAKKSGLTDRAIRAAVGRLVTAGHLTRHENVGKGVFYRVHPGGSAPVPTADGLEIARAEAAHHYVYRLTDPETHEFYIGLRSCECPPDADEYTGSGAWPTAMRGRLCKEVLERFSSRNDAAQAESRLVAAALGHPLCRNKKAATPERRSPGTSFPRNETSLTPEPPSANTSVTTKPISEAKASSIGRAKPRKHFVPAGWSPSEAHVLKAQTLGLDLHEQAEAFREFEFDKPKADFDLAFHRWLRTANKFAPRKQNDRSSAKLDDLAGIARAMEAACQPDEHPGRDRWQSGDGRGVRALPSAA